MVEEWNHAARRTYSGLGLRWPPPRYPAEPWVIPWAFFMAIAGEPA
jgi:hypothetical protein